MREKAKALVLAVLIGAAGAGGFTALGVPAGALIGASLAVALAAAANLPVDVPARLRDVAFCVIGISLGSGIDPDIGHRVIAWGLSLGFLVLSLIVTLACGALVLTRGFGYTRETAVLATAPGTMSNVIALALEGRGDVNAIMVLQIVRMLVLVALVPPLATLLDTAPVAPVLRAAMPVAAFALLLAAAYGLGFLGQRRGVPAACLLAGLVLSGGGHAAGLVQGAAPAWALFAGFTLTGATLGTRLTSVGLVAIVRMAKAGAALVATTLAVSFVFAALTSAVTGLPLAEVWIAFAPGGVEAMAAIGLSLGFDPAYVALHHFARILTLIVLVPLATRGGRSGA